MQGARADVSILDGLERDLAGKRPQAADKATFQRLRSGGESAKVRSG